MNTPYFLSALFAAMMAALLSILLTWIIRPVLLKYALAKPNARSSHREPTPQGAGIAVIIATVTVSTAFCFWVGIADPSVHATLIGATLLIAVVGFADDIRSIPVVPRLLLQAASVAAVVLTAPDTLRVAQGVPIWVERGLILLAGVWFVNLVNFMDGLDLLTVAEVVPVSAAMVLLGWLGQIPMSAAIVAAALCGAMIGFAPFNRPIAKIFLGDVGSLPIGLLLGWCLLQLAYNQQLVTALLLPLYYLTDATVTLALRIARREPFWAAHRSHFYQRATDNGFTTWEVVGHIFALNVGLAILAVLSSLSGSLPVQLVLLLIGWMAVAILMYRFSRPDRSCAEPRAAD